MDFHGFYCIVCSKSNNDMCKNCIGISTISESFLFILQKSLFSNLMSAFYLALYMEVAQTYRHLFVDLSKLLQEMTVNSVVIYFSFPSILTDFTFSGRSTY